MSQELVIALIAAGAALLGVIVSGGIQALFEWQRVKRERDIRVEKRQEFLADRDREERRGAYTELLVELRSAEEAIHKHLYQNFETRGGNVGAYEGWEVSASILKDLHALWTRHQLLASKPVRDYMTEVISYLNAGCYDIADGRTSRKKVHDPNPIDVLEDLLAVELQYRDQAEVAGAPKQTLEVLTASEVESVVEKRLLELLNSELYRKQSPDVHPGA